MENQNGGKATIREVRDLIDKLDDEKISPMRLDIATMKTLLTEMSKSYREFCDANNKDHKNFISIKAFSGWLAILVSVLGIITTILFLR